MMRFTAARAAAVVGVAVLVLAGCTTAEQGTPAATTATDATVSGTATATAASPAATEGAAVAGTPLYLVDGNTSNSLGASLPLGLLTNVKGTIPGAETTQDFTDALLQVDPTLTSFAFAPEAYDAVVLTALAAAAASSDAGVDMARQLVPITNGTEVCNDFAGCMELLKLGKSIDYNGRSGAVNFSGGGDPTSASIGVYTFGPDNVLLPDVTYTEGEILPDPHPIEPGKGPIQKGAGDGVLTLATFLPTTGNFAYLGPPEIAGVKLAIADIEAAGGIPGIDSIALVQGDSGDVSTDQGQRTLKRLLPKKPDAIIGAASSASTLAVLDAVTSAGILMFSPANSSPALSSVPDRGLYWRTSPSDVLQGAVVGSEVLNDGHAKVAILSIQDAYGDGLNANVTSAINEGGGQVVANVVYDPKGTDFAAAVAKVKGAAPDAIVLIGFDESSRLIQELAKQGIGPNLVG